MSTAIGDPGEISIKLTNAQTKSKHFTIKCKFDISEAPLAGGEAQVDDDAVAEMTQPQPKMVDVRDEI